MSLRPALLPKNENGGYYAPGKTYDLAKKLEVYNARIHTGGDATVVKDLLWDTVVEGRPLNAYVLLLPTRSPELNPIELVFQND